MAAIALSLGTHRTTITRWRQTVPKLVYQQLTQLLSKEVVALRF